MAQHEIEVILTRQLASYLAMPIFLVDPHGTLLYYNEPAEAILGQRFEETGEMPASEWSTIFTPFDETGAPIPPDQLALMIALHQRHPAFVRHGIRALNGAARTISVTAFPLIGQAGRFLGAVAIFWQDPDTPTHGSP